MMMCYYVANRMAKINMLCEKYVLKSVTNKWPLSYMDLYDMWGA